MEIVSINCSDKVRDVDKVDVDDAGDGKDVGDMGDVCYVDEIKS